MLLPQGLPHDASVDGHRVDAILRYLEATTGACFLALIVVLAIALFRHRAGRRVAHYTHGHDRAHFLIAGFAASVVFFGIDLAVLARSFHDLRAGFWSLPEADPRAVRVEVTAQQWDWNFRLPGDDGVFLTADDVVTLDELRVPEGRPVILQLRSKDVIHSFYLPNFRAKMDAIPGGITTMWFAPRERGIFEIACSQYCGASHYKMRGTLQVMAEDEWRRWAVRAAHQTAARGPGTLAAGGVAADGWAWGAP